MNIITCSENCIHQKKGYCTLEGEKPAAEKSGSCWYFTENKKPSATENAD